MSLPDKPTTRDLLLAAIAKRDAAAKRAMTPTGIGETSERHSEQARGRITDALDLLSRNLHPFDMRALLTPDGSEQQALLTMLDACEAAHADDPVTIWQSFRVQGQAYLKKNPHDGHTLALNTVPAGPKYSATGKYTRAVRAAVAEEKSERGKTSRFELTGRKRLPTADSEVSPAEILGNRWEFFKRKYALHNADLLRILNTHGEFGRTYEDVHFDVGALRKTNNLRPFFELMRDKPDAVFAELATLAGIGDDETRQQEFEAGRNALLEALSAPFTTTRRGPRRG